MRSEFYFNIDLLSTTVGVNDAAGPIVVVSGWGSATSFLTSFPVQTEVIIFHPLLVGNIASRSGRFEEAVCLYLYGRRDGEEGEQECRQTDRDGHGAACGGLRV